MKKIMIYMSVLWMFTVVEGAEVLTVQTLQALRTIFLKEVAAHYEKMNESLKSFEPEGSERRDREENWIKNVRQRNRNIENFIQSIRASEIGQMFRAACAAQTAPLKYVTIHPTKMDTVVFDSLQVPETFAYYYEKSSKK